MKNAALLLLQVVLMSCVFATNKSKDNFIIIDGQTYYCNEVRVGKAFTRIYFDDKQFFKIPTAKIDAYADKGKFYEYLPILTRDKDTVGWAFMQYITSCDGNRLYRYCSNCLKYDPVNEKIDPELPVYRYYIFKSGKFISVTDDFDLQSQVASFGVKVIG